ncbi:MAG: hypothetical protein R8F63_11920 [Acidimicrobiales bacterium]|nr:hypothetical protein [Acidimicrobiales bacterium]
MSVLRRGLPPRGSLRLTRLLGAAVTAALLIGSCSFSAEGDTQVAALPAASDAAPTWWFDAPCDPATAACRPPLPADPPPATVELEAGHTASIDLTDADAIVVGSPGATIGSIEVSAPGVRIVGVDVEVIVVNPNADGASIESSRIGQLFVNGADGVLIRGNLIRPYELGPDGVQIKTFDGDTPENLLFEANVIGPQDSDGEAHTDCVQILGGDQIHFARNVVLPCGDKAFQIRSGAGGVVGHVRLEGNVIYECPEQRVGCEGFHAIVWASTDTSVLELVHNTIRGSVGISSGGSTVDPGDNLIASGNIVASLPCTPATVENLTVSNEPCDAGSVQADFPAFVDDAPDVGDLRLLDPTAVPVASEPFGPSIWGDGICAAPRFGAAIACS